MSATFRAAAKALSDNPALLAKVTASGSAEERAAHFKSAGISAPNHADVNSHMADVAGGLTTESGGYISTLPPGYTYANAAAGAAAA